MNQGNSNHAGIVKSKNGAVVFIAVIFLIASAVLGWRVIAHVHDSRTGIYDSILESAYKFRFIDKDYYRRTEEDIIARGKRATIEGFVSGGLIVTSLILLSLSSRHCSECGTKVAIETAKKCGSCGTQFKNIEI